MSSAEFFYMDLIFGNEARLLHGDDDGGDEKKLDEDAVDGGGDGLSDHHFQIEGMGFVKDTEKKLGNAPSDPSEKLGAEKGAGDAHGLFGQIAIKEARSDTVYRKLRHHSQGVGVEGGGTEDQISKQRGHTSHHASPNGTCNEAAKENGEVHGGKLNPDGGDISGQ